MIDTKQLRDFVAVAETLHFGKAAARTHVSQPPLSRRIAGLEQEIGVRLFERGTRSVMLTKAGERLYADATAILAGLGRARDSAVAADRGLTGQLTIGFTMYAAYNVLPTLAKECLADFPEIALRLREYFPGPLQNALMADEVDIAIMLPPAVDCGFEVLTLLREPLVAALPRTHTLAGATIINLSDLSDEPFLLTPREATPVLHDTIMAACHSHGFAPSVRLEIFLQQTVVNLVNEGLGVALVPSSLQKTGLPNVSFIPLIQAPTVELMLAWKKTTRNPCVSTFINLARKRHKPDVRVVRGTSGTNPPNGSRSRPVPRIR